MDKLYDQLVKLNTDNVYPFHMPGHKRILPEYIERDMRFSWLHSINQLDITEIDGLDNLAKADGVIKNIEDNISTLYGSKKSYISVNGSTAGILSAIHSCVSQKDCVLLGRNCHKSVYHALDLLNADPVYLYPSIDTEYGIPGQIMPEAVEKAIDACILENKFPKAMIISSPTYEGIVSDIRGISEICQKNNIILIVDEAHGAHLAFANKDYFPDSAVNLGADIVVQSLHKTLPALTQTAVVHLCTDKIPEARLKKYINYFQTSSPSYIMLSSIEGCVDIINEHGQKLFADYEENLKSFYQKAGKLNCLRVRPQSNNCDPGKILISTKGTGSSGQSVYDTLRLRFMLQGEMHGFDYVLMMTSIFDSKGGFERLLTALFEIDDELCKRMYIPEDKLTPDFSKEIDYINSLVGTISEEFITPYPPGIPLIVPGEAIDKKNANKIIEYLENGIMVEYM